MSESEIYDRIWRDFQWLESKLEAEDKTYLDAAITNIAKWVAWKFEEFLLWEP